MKKKNLPIIISLLLITLIVIGILLANSLDETDNQKPLVYMVVKNTEESMGFWQAVKMGAEVAATELGVDMIYTGPKRETNVKEQIQIIREIINEKPTAMAVAATDFLALKGVGEEIIAAGIPLVTFDSEIDMDTPHSFIATNNIEAAKTMAHELAKVLEYDGTVAVMSHVYGSSTAIQREAGFREVMSHYEDIELIDKTWFSNNSTETAYSKTLEIVEKYPNITAIFGANEISLIGIARAIHDLKLQDQIIVVGFDSNKEIVEKIELGVIHAIMVQRPFNMGYQSIKEAIEIALYDKQPENVDTGAVLITKENLYTPENEKLLFPFVNE